MPTNEAPQLTFDPNDSLAVQKRWKELLTVANARLLTEFETAEGVMCTRILRRTNTGPAKAKTSKTKDKVSKLDALRASLLED